MRILVIGASGQVGALLYSRNAEAGNCVGTFLRRSAPGLVRLDLHEGKQVERLIEETAPEVCYLPAALTHVDQAELQPHECHAVNVEGVAHVARALARSGGILVLFSTDHVFGDGRRPWHESEPTQPLSVYASSKVHAEEVVRAVLPERHLILRTSWVFGPDPQQKNFYYRVRATLGRRERLMVPDDQFGQPTYGPDLAQAADELVQRGTRGTFHVVGPRLMTRLDWACAIAVALGLPTDLIVGCPTSDLTISAPRPLLVALDRRKLLRCLGRDPIRPPEEALVALAGAGKFEEALI
jgi:dTDP-4-dehydrorhamnose reductase